MQSASFIFTVVVSSLFIFSTNLEAMELSQTKPSRQYSKKHPSTFQSILSQTDAKYHIDLTKNLQQESESSSEWLKKLINKCLADQFDKKLADHKKNASRNHRRQPKKKRTSPSLRSNKKRTSPEGQIAQLEQIQKILADPFYVQVFLTNDCVISCKKFTPSLAAQILESLITATRSKRHRRRF